MIEEAAGADLDQVQHALERLGAATVGIGDLAAGDAGGELQEQAEAGLRPRRAQRPEIGEVVPVHRQHQIEAPEVVDRDPAGAQRRQVDAAPAGRRRRPGIGRLADVEAVGACAVDAEPIAEPLARGQRAEHALGRGRATDVAEADKQNVDQRRLLPEPSAGLSSSEGERAMMRATDAAAAKAKPIVVLTGAGISKESGLDTFRDADGIWAKVRLEDVATPEAFARDPELVQDFYNARRRQLVSGPVEPNAAHRALARLEEQWPGEVLIVTQNIDNLHERAGSRNLLHMHGELLKIRCDGCGTIASWYEDLTVDHACPACGRKGWLRPHVVWFGEMPLEMERIYAALGRCGLFLSIGTSGNVYPAAGFVSHVRRYTDAHAVELNMEPSAGATLFTETIYGAATRVVPDYVDRLLAGAYRCRPEARQ